VKQPEATAEITRWSPSSPDPPDRSRDLPVLAASRPQRM